MPPKRTSRRSKSRRRWGQNTQRKKRSRRESLFGATQVVARAENMNGVQGMLYFDGNSFVYEEGDLHIDFIKNGDSWDAVLPLHRALVFKKTMNEFIKTYTDFQFTPRPTQSMFVLTLTKKQLVAVNEYDEYPHLRLFDMNFNDSWPNDSTSLRSKTFDALMTHTLSFFKKALKDYAREKLLDPTYFDTIEDLKRVISFFESLNSSKILQRGEWKAEFDKLDHDAKDFFRTIFSDDVVFPTLKDSFVSFSFDSAHRA